MRVSTAEFISRVNDLTDRAETEPVMITKGGRDRLVLVSADEYARLVDRDRSASATIRPNPIGGGTPEIWGALRGTMSWDKDSDITEPVGEVWDAER